MMNERKIIDRLKTLGIAALTDIKTLNLLDGDYINLEATLPNGSRAKILDDGKKYLACEICADDGLCYGIAADDGQIAVFTYEDHGENAKLIAWLRI